MKCMEKDRTRRYETANGVASDIQRHLENQPVEAGPPTVAYRFRKFARRNKAALITTTAVAASLIIGLTLATVGLVMAMHERDRAEANFQKARDAVNQMLSEVGSKDLANVPQMETLRKVLLENAVTFYEGFLKEESVDATVRYEAVQAYTKLGHINARLGHSDQADQAYRRAMILLETLAERHPDEPDYRFSAANIQAKLGQRPEAIKSLEALVESFPDVAEYRYALANNLSTLGGQLWSEDRHDEAERVLHHSVALLEALVKELPDRPSYHSLLGGALNNLCLVLGSGEHSRKLLEQAIVHQKAALELNPRSSEYRRGLYTHYANLPQTEPVLQEVLRLSEEQAALFPDTPMYRFDVGRALGHLSDFLRSQKRWEDARDTSERAVTVYAELASQFPDVAKYRQELAFIHGNVAGILKQLAAAEEAEQHCRQARDLLQPLIEQGSATPRIKHALAVVQGNLGDFTSDRGSYTEADRAVRQAHGLWSELLASFPDSDTYRHYLAEASRELAGFSLSAFDPKRVNVAEALQFARQSVELDPSHAKCWRALGAAFYRAADYPAALAPLEKAIELRGGDANAYEWFFLAMTRWQLGDKEQSREFYDRAVEWTKKNEPKNDELRRLRAEATQLLVIED